MPVADGATGAWSLNLINPPKLEHVYCFPIFLVFPFLNASAHQGMKALICCGSEENKGKWIVEQTHFLNTASHGPLKVTTKAGSPSYTNSTYYAPVESPSFNHPGTKKKKEKGMFPVNACTKR